MQHNFYALTFITVFSLIIANVVVKFSVSQPCFHYSEGERIGVLRKLSKKGFFYKTYEGELMLNAGMGSVKLDTFNFSLDANSPIADSLLNNIGKEIKLSYDEYLIVPYSIGSSNYLINSYSIIER